MAFWSDQLVDCIDWVKWRRDTDRLTGAARDIGERMIRLATLTFFPLSPREQVEFELGSGD